jgi:hypothetical protein
MSSSSLYLPAMIVPGRSTIGPGEVGERASLGVDLEVLIGFAARIQEAGRVVMGCEQCIDLISKCGIATALGVNQFPAIVNTMISIAR